MFLYNILYLRQLRTGNNQPIKINVFVSFISGLNYKIKCIASFLQKLKFKESVNCMNIDLFG